MAPIDGGMEASRRMHEYLLSKQRKQEEYWLRKYGKVLQAPPPSLGKPAGNPRLPPVGGGNNSTSGQSSTYSSNTQLTNDPSATSGGLFPPLPGAQVSSGPPPSGLPPHHPRQPKGNAPIFHANEPVKDFFSRNTRQPHASVAAAARDEYAATLPPGHRPPEPYRARGLPQQLPPMAGYEQQGRDSSENGEPQQRLQHPQEQEYLEASSPQQQQEYVGYSQHQHQHMHAHQHQQQQYHQQQASSRGGYIPPPRVGVPQPRVLPPLSGEASSARSVGSANGAKPLRNLEMELAVIRAIKAREDVLERLRIASGKLDSGFGGSAPVVLSPVDPLVRLFYRLVGTLRQRTLDVIEAIAAWRRKVNPTDPFIYYGVDYLAAIGPDLGFLDELPFMRTRLTFTRAADDPFLSEVTSDGIPIEEATTCDLRRGRAGGQRFSSDALRIRMARKVLAHYCGRPLPGNTSSYMLDGGSSAMSGGGLQSEPSQPRSVRSLAATAQGEEEDIEPSSGMTTQQIIRALSPPVPPVTSLQPPAARAITPPAVTDSAAADPAAVRQQDEEVERSGRDWEERWAQEEGSRVELEEEDERQKAASRVEVAEAAVAAAVEAGEKEQLQEPNKAMEAVDIQAVGDQDTFDETSQEQQTEEKEEEEAKAETQPEAQGGPEQRADAPAGAELAVPEPPQPASLVSELMMFEDDNDYIDFALGAIVSSLEPPLVDTIPSGGFTVAGWEIDHHLDEVVRGIASPDRFSGESARGTPMRANSVAASTSKAPADAGSPQRSSVPVISPSIYGDATATPPALQSSGRIPQPPSDPKPLSRGRISDASTVVSAPKPLSRGSCIPVSPPVAPPPVRVHLNPRNSGINMALSMDEEGPIGQPSFDGSLGRPTSRDNSSSSLSKDTMPSTRPEGLPSILEDQSAMFVGYDGASSRPPVRVHLNPLSSGLDLDLSIDSEEIDAQATVSSTSGATTAVPTTTNARPPVRVHLNPRNSGINMALSMDEEGPIGQPSFDGSLGRPTSRDNSSRRSGVANPTISSSAYDDGLPSILGELGARLTGNGGQELVDGTTVSAAPTSAAKDGGDGGSLPSVRVHLNANSREVNMVLSMDDDGMLLASPATETEIHSADSKAAAAAAALVPPLDDMPAPLQGPLSGRGNRASIRRSRQEGLRPGSSEAVSASGDGL